MTDNEISQALHSFLHYYYSSSSSQLSEPNSLSAPFNSIIGHLEEKLGVGLAHKADFIRAQIQQYIFQPPTPPPPQPQQHQQWHHFQQHHQPHLYQHHPHHHQHHQSYPHQHPQIQTHQTSLIQPNDHYVLQQTPIFHPGLPPTFFSSFVPKKFPFRSIQTHPVKPDPTTNTDASKLGGPSKAKRRGGAGGLNKLCGVSPELEVVVGHPTLPRTEIVKQLWAYIRKNNLQDPSNKRKIICDEALRIVFETDCTDMFKMNKLLSKHIIHLDPNKESSTKKQKVANEEKESFGVTQVTAPNQSSSPSLSTSPAPNQTPTSVGISEELANFFGVGVREMPQSEVFNRVLNYINANNLEDPVNPTVIVCDSKLQELFGCQSFLTTKLIEILSRQHIFRA